MDLGEQAHRVKFMIGDRSSNYTAAFDAVLAGAGIRTVLCNVRTPRMTEDRTLDRRMPPRASRPHPDLKSEPSTADPAPVRDSPRSTPAAPVAGFRRPAENRYHNRSFSGSTAYEDRLAPVARSTNIAWSRGVDQIVGTHKSNTRIMSS
jgi:hypothetical protein